MPDNNLELRLTLGGLGFVSAFRTVRPRYSGTVRQYSQTATSTSKMNGMIPITKPWITARKTAKTFKIGLNTSLR